MGDYVLMGCRASRVALTQNEYLLRKRAFRGTSALPVHFVVKHRFVKRPLLKCAVVTPPMHLLPKQDLRQHHVLRNQARLE
jgi:hypothetical protein